MLLFLFSSLFVFLEFEPLSSAKEFFVFGWASTLAGGDAEL
jgi:hypothetical protein